MSPSWTLRSWPPVLWQPRGTDDALHFEHRGTAVNPYAPGELGTTGHTLWAGNLGCGHCGIAWDWSVVAPGVVALTDPMSVITNMCVVGPHGDVLTSWQAARFLNDVVFQLPWQTKVERALADCDQTVYPARLPPRRQRPATAAALAR